MAESEKKSTISNAEKMEVAERFKKEGNELYKAKKYKGAIGKYHRAIIQLKAVGQNKSVGSIMGLSAEQTETPVEILDQTNRLKGDCYNNLAACMLQQEDPNYEKIIEHCDNALEVSHGNVKALYRKGVASYHLKNFDDALNLLLQSGQNDSQTRKFITLSKEAIAQQEKELKAAYQKMFKQTDKT